MATLPEGIGFQCYRDTVPGATTAARRAACARACDAFKKAGGTWVAWHGFSVEFTPDKVTPLCDIAKQAGLASWVAFGLDDTDMPGKGRRIGTVANLPGVAGVIFDLEGYGEDDDTETDRREVEALRGAFRKVAPNATTIVQGWELPQKHPTMAYRELAALADCWSPMQYLNNWTSAYGKARAAVMEPKWREGERWLRDKIAPRVLPFFRSTHNVGWSDIPEELDATMTTHRARLLIWCEPFPSTQVLAAVKRAVASDAGGKVPRNG